MTSYVLWPVVRLDWLTNPAALLAIVLYCIVNEELSPHTEEVEGLLTKTVIYLAKSIARDGEEATVLGEVRVSGTENDADARSTAKTIAGSNRTKAAILEWIRIGDRLLFLQAELVFILMSIVWRFDWVTTC